MTFKLTNITRGFTLIETLLAVLLLTTAIAGPLTIASNALNSGVVAKDQITAFYLAQDAMEYVRFIRDTACLRTAASAPAGGCPVSGADGWLYDLVQGGCVSADANNPVYCKIDSVQGTVSTFASTDILKYDSSNRYYSYTTGTQTPQQFTRKISIINDPATPDEATVTVTVTWRNLAGITHAPITIRENILRWQ